ncbi:hypothetical protein NFI96_002233 [Prochilodus magdalenae]|nr:hypothetical protein NFI96_002233 [Prochilodus magdalenae]
MLSHPSTLLRTQILLATLALLAGVCLARSDAPRGVSLPFVFDVKAVCDPPCKHAGICIRNNTCFCSRGYEGETCQYAICPQGCRNGGSCVAPGICSCPEGWLGGACHTAVCKKPCLNGGKCVSPDTCRCRAPFSGPQCQERKKLF